MGAYPPQLYNLKRDDIMKAMPEFSRLTDFCDTFVVRELVPAGPPGTGSEAEKSESILTMGPSEAAKRIEGFDYNPMIIEANAIAQQCLENRDDLQLGAYMFMYRAVARHIAAIYLHIDQYCAFHSNFDASKNFLHQNFGFAKESVPEGLETLVLDTEKATRGYGPDDDTETLIKEGKLSFVLAYPDYAAAYCRPGADPTDVHQLQPVAYLLGGEAEKYFKLLHLAVESKLGVLVQAAQALIDDVPSEQRAEIIHKAADAATDAASVIIKMPELSDPAAYLHLRWFIQGPYGSPSYPNGLRVRGHRIAPGGETGSQSTFAIISDLISGVRFAFQDDKLHKMEEIHRLTRERESIMFVDRLREAAQKCSSVCDEEKRARARLLQATNFYLLGHSAAYTIHVLAQQKSTVQLDKPSGAKEDVATGGSAGSFLIKKVLERQEFLERLIMELEDSKAPFDTTANELFKRQLEAVKLHTQGEGRDSDGPRHGLDLTILKELVGHSEEKAVSIHRPVYS